MILYLDTSVLVAALTSEETTTRTRLWLGNQPPGSLAISEWVRTEVASALSLKLRTGALDLASRAMVLSVLATLLAESLTVLPVAAETFRAAARFVESHELGLRAGDALHLAVCAEFGATLCTLDQRLASAGPPLGIPTLLL